MGIAPYRFLWHSGMRWQVRLALLPLLARRENALGAHALFQDTADHHPRIHRSERMLENDLQLGAQCA